MLLPLLALGVCVFALSIPARSAAITVDITSPKTTQVVGDSLQINATVSSTFEITSVVADVSGPKTSLASSDGIHFAGVLSLSGFPRGQGSILITATDAFGNN